MAPTRSLHLIALTVVAVMRSCAYGHQHKVGESIWSIPPNQDFYNKWSADQFFQAGDSLVFMFKSNFHNVMQVSKREYEHCSWENPFRKFFEGPATVPLYQEGVYYFICSFGNYCLLGQRFLVVVHSSSTPAPPPPPPLSLPPNSPIFPSLSPSPSLILGLPPDMPISSMSTLTHRQKQASEVVPYSVSPTDSSQILSVKKPSMAPMTVQSLGWFVDACLRESCLLLIVFWTLFSYRVDG